MKKGDEIVGIVESISFPNKAVVALEEDTKKCHVKNGIPGQKVKVRITKKRADKYEGQVIDVIEKAENEIEPSCRHFGLCGGCSYQNLAYEDQLALKKSQIDQIFRPVITNELTKNRSMYESQIADFDGYFDQIFEGIKASPVHEKYRNKMEFSFGDSCKDGDLELGLHKKGSFYDIVSVTGCQIVDEDFALILKTTLGYFRGKGCSYYHKMTHEGFLRHLLVRKAAKTGEIMICLVTTSKKPQEVPCTEVSIVDDWKEEMLALNLSGQIAGVLHIINDSLSDVVQSDETKVLYGRDYINEEVLGLKFKISPFSFFQTNTLSAEVIYETAREYINLGDDAKNSTVFDLYSGTGTIAQLLAPAAGKVVGVEIVEEAVEAAKENVVINGLDNCHFIAGDVLKVLDEIGEKPDFIILDPPRDGINPKALRKIIDYGVDSLVYISCKPTSLARDLEMLIGCGYLPKRLVAVDQFPGTVHVEVVTLLCRQKQ